MLVLSRRPNEDVIVRTPDGREITFRIIEVDRNKIRVGIEAPRDFEIYRPDGGLLPPSAKAGEAAP